MTIYALSSGPGISGISVIRVSGKNTSKVIMELTGKELPHPRVATLRRDAMKKPVKVAGIKKEDMKKQPSLIS